jgi:hypothetical protein
MTEVLRGFSKALQVNDGIIISIRPRKFFPYPFGYSVIRCCINIGELLGAALNKQYTNERKYERKLDGIYNYILPGPKSRDADMYREF